MKAKLSVLILTSIITSPMALAADDSGDGQVHITGNIIQSACTIATESKAFDVVLEDRNTTAFVAAGDTSAEKPFTIKLENCDSEAYKNVRVRFEGNQDTDANSTVLVNTGVAKGIGVQILDNGTPMDFVDHSGWSTTNFSIEDNEGNPVLPFTARYYATKAQAGIVAGSVDTTATFYLQYN